MSRYDTIHVWEVEASDRADQPYWSNLRVAVVARTMEDAIATFRQQHPDARLHKVLRRDALGKNAVLIAAGVTEGEDQ